MGKSRKTKTMRKVDKQIARDLDSAQKELFNNLVSGTPIDTGAAQKGWKNVFDVSDLMGTGKTKVVIRNDIDYIERLDNGWSRQAPSGIVQPAIRKSRKF